MGYDDIKDTIKGLLLIYALVGSAYEFGRGTTGHVSADRATGISQPTRLEMILQNAIKIKSDERKGVRGLE